VDAGLVLLHVGPEEVIGAILADPLVMIASDGLLDPPRAAG
jgi:hypothetical protein